MTTPTTQPDDRCEQIVREIASELAMDSAHIPAIMSVISKHLQPALQSKQDEMDALRDKLKASQPTSPQPQTPHQ